MPEAGELPFSPIPLSPVLFPSFFRMGGEIVFFPNEIFLPVVRPYGKVLS